MTETTQEEREQLRSTLSAIKTGQAFGNVTPWEQIERLLNDADRLAAIERRIENLINGKKLHADRLREEGKGEHCEGFIDALDDEVDDLIAILCPPEGT